MADKGISSLKEQGKAALAFVGLAIVSVLGIIVLSEFKTSTSAIPALGNTTIDLFIAAIAIFGTFATIMALIVVTKGIIGLVKGVQ